MSADVSSRMRVGFILVGLVGLLGWGVCSQSPKPAPASETRREAVEESKEHASVAFVPWDAAGEISRMDTHAKGDVAAEPTSEDEVPKGVDPVQLRATIARLSKLYASHGAEEIRNMNSDGRYAAAAIRE